MEIEIRETIVGVEDEQGNLRVERADALMDEESTVIVFDAMSISNGETMTFTVPLIIA